MIFEVDERTAAVITGLWETFGVKTNADMLRKALALAVVARDNMNFDHTITIAPDGKTPIRISLAE